jgi:Ca2+-binding RTX toxin-like protein
MLKLIAPVALALLAFCGQADAASTTLGYSADPGEANRLTVTSTPNGYRFTDTGATISPGPFCTPASDHSVVCPSTGAGILMINLGDGDDTATLVTNGLSARAEIEVDAGGGNDVINGGTHGEKLAGSAGDDTLRGGGGDDEVDGGRGVDTLSGGPGNDELHFQENGAMTFDFGVDGAGGLTAAPEEISEFESVDVLGTGPKVVSGTEGRNRVEVGPGSQLTADTKAGDDRVLVVGGHPHDITLGDGDDTARIYGSRASGAVECGRGRDTVVTPRAVVVNDCERWVGFGFSARLPLKPGGLRVGCGNREGTAPCRVALLLKDAATRKQIGPIVRASIDERDSEVLKLAKPLRPGRRVAVRLIVRRERRAYASGELTTTVR